MSSVPQHHQESYLVASLGYLAEVIQTRLRLEMGKESPYQHIGEITPPTFNGDESPFVRYLQDHCCNRNELVLLTLALVPHLLPNWLESTIKSVLQDKALPPQLGLVRGKDYQGLLPTGQTLLYLLAGDHLERRWEMQGLFDETHFFAQDKVLGLELVNEGEPRMSGKLLIAADYLDWFTIGQLTRPKFTTRFPAQYIETEMEWEDLVLNSQTKKQVSELLAWMKHGKILLHDWGMKKKYKLGYRVLFHGPPGTGKTLTATLLGKAIQRDVYKVDLSLVVSKFIGETEKNLANLFDKAENKGWILFFDEADALFGKRTNVRDAHDKYANQEVSFLLQRVENYDGLVILASNFKSNIDDAFLRRFQSIIYFPMPQARERLKLWKNAFPPQLTLNEKIDLEGIAQKYELSGASIVNIALRASLLTMEANEETIHADCLRMCIESEFQKHGKIV